MGKKLYTVPDYYPEFRCKMGECRHSCCDGWPVSISLKDYYRLLGGDYSPDLRRRIDCSLHLHDAPTNEDYAFIEPNYFGKCPMQMEDGRCAIHAELGEGALTAICRLYPRGIRAEGDLECSCANSCERVIEMFLRHPDPLRFIRIPLEMDVPQEKERSIFFETVGREQEIRLYFIKFLQHREVSLPARFVALGNAMHAMQECLRRKDEAGVDALLRENKAIQEEQSHAPTHDEMRTALRLAEKLMQYIDEHSDSIHDFGQASLQYFGNDECSLERYGSALQIYARVLPDWQIAFEHMLVNHMFFERFPFQDRPESIYDEFAALCIIYVILRFLSLGWVALHPNEDAFTDVCAAAFRYFDHTSFDRYASRILPELGCATSESVLRLLML